MKKYTFTLVVETKPQLTEKLNNAGHKARIITYGSELILVDVVAGTHEEAEQLFKKVAPGRHAIFSNTRGYEIEEEE